MSLAKEDVKGEMARDGRARDSDAHQGAEQEQPSGQEDFSGANKNRTCDLSIISSSQGYDLEDIGRFATF